MLFSVSVGTAADLQALAAAAKPPAGGDAQLIAAALLGIAAVVLLITLLRVHPFLALILGSALLGLVAGMQISKTIDSFTAGVGSTVGSVGLLIALGSMIGRLLADSGGADGVVGTVVKHVSGNALPWALAGVAVLIGLPLFFEVGVVLLVPVILLVSRQSKVPLMYMGISALAGLSVLHGLVPPHPGPLIAIAALKADLGLTLVYGLIVAIPTVIIAGPLFGAFISRYVHAVAPATLVAAYGVPGEKAPPPQVRHQPAFATAVAVMLLPIVLMLLRAFGELFLPSDSNLRSAFDVAGTPLVALLAGVLLAMYALGVRSGMNRGQLSESIGAALPPIAGILLIVAAGGGFKQVLVDAGVGDMVGRAAQGASLSPLVLGWLVAVGIRVATGSATVATITAAGIVAPLAATLTPSGASLLALAIGSGSLFFSHVNDAGFWLVKEYFGLTVGETLKSWSVMETIISVVGLGGVLLLNVFVGG